MTAPALVGWTPVHVAWSDGQPVVEWRDLSGLAFEDPLFDHTVQHALREPYRLMFAARTGIDQLEAVARASEPVPPSGFILHASRCGSTLVSSMLATLDATIVASEPPAVDGVLRADIHGRVDDDTRRAWLRWTLAALGQPRVGGERRFFVKLDAWSTRDLRLLRELFPAVPCLFVYRDPAEILAAQMRVRGAHMIPGVLPPRLFGLELAEALELTPEEYCARVIAAIFESALEHLDDCCLLVNYAQLPGAVEQQILAHLELEITPAERERMRSASLLDAKNPVLPFDPHVPGRVWPVTPSLRAACDRFAAEAYARLEQLRRAQSELAR
jgi:hypothetical protein